MPPTPTAACVPPSALSWTQATPPKRLARKVPAASPNIDFNLKFADAIRHALLDAGFDKTVRLITTTAHVRGLLERATRANEMHADLFIAVHHNSVPENLIEKWEYQGEERKFSDRFTGYSIFISQDNGDRDGSLEFGQLLGTALQARGLAYTPHYTLALMGGTAGSSSIRSRACTATTS